MIVVITTKQNEAFRGRRRFAWLRPVIRLDQAETIGEGVEPQRVKGRLEVPKANVAYVQVMPEELPPVVQPNGWQKEVSPPTGAPPRGLPPRIAP